MNWLMFIGGVGQVAVLVLLSFVGLMLRARVQSSEVAIMHQARTEFVSAPVNAQQFATTNLLLTNLGTQMAAMQDSTTNIAVRLSRVEGVLEKIRNGESKV